VHYFPMLRRHLGHGCIFDNIEDANALSCDIWLSRL
jgi:hypothetical protein